MLIVAQALAGLVVARPRSHIHLALPGGEAVLRWGTHAGVVAAKAQKVDPRCDGLLSGLGSKPEQEVCENRLEAAWVRRLPLLATASAQVLGLPPIKLCEGCGPCSKSCQGSGSYRSD